LSKEEFGKWEDKVIAVGKSLRHGVFPAAIPLSSPSELKK
jgi:hypothetical protein